MHDPPAITDGWYMLFSSFIYISHPFLVAIDIWVEVARWCIIGRTLVLHAVPFNLYVCLAFLSFIKKQKHNTIVFFLGIKGRSKCPLIVARRTWTDWNKSHFPRSIDVLWRYTTSQYVGISEISTLEFRLVVGRLSKMMISDPVRIIKSKLHTFDILY